MISLFINGTKHDLDVDPEMPLLWAIRDVVGLTGTKYGCGKALCGACTVHIDGKPARSCSIPVGNVEGRTVTTIEGVNSATSRAVQAAWNKLQVPQCGYCQSGQIMQAASLLNQNPDPSDKEIVDGMAGNICRCGTYQRIFAAVRTAATEV